MSRNLDKAQGRPCALSGDAVNITKLVTVLSVDMFPIFTHRHEFSVESKMGFANFARMALSLVLVVVVSFVCFPATGR